MRMGRYVVALTAMIGAAPLLADPGCFVGFADPVWFDLKTPWSNAEVSAVKGGGVHGGHSGVADFDADGDLDVVFATSDSGSAQWGVVIVFNDGLGGFHHQTFIAGPADSGPASRLSVGDVTGDGLIDIVLPMSGVPEWIFPALGGGAFGEPISLPGGFNARDSLIVDLDGDALHDVVIAYSGGELVIHRSLGGGQFAPPQFVSVGPEPRLNAGDVDGDGRQDIVAASQFFANDGIIILLNRMKKRDEAFHFEREIIDFAGYEAVVSDLDGTSPNEIIATHGLGIRSFRRTGDSEYHDFGFFQAPSGGTEIAIADFDLDGYLDAAFPAETFDGLIMQRGVGGGAFSSFPDIAPQTAFTFGDGVINMLDLSFLLAEWGEHDVLTFEDLNRDGVVNGVDISLLLTRWGPYHCGHGQILETTSPIGGVSAGDFDGDGDVDVLVGRTGYQVGLCRNATVD